MHASQIEISIAYIHGRIETQLEAFAQSLGITQSELTFRLGTLLLTGSQERTEDSMPKLRRKTTKAHKAIRKMEMARSSSKNSSRKMSKIKQYWAKMTPEQRSTEVKRRQAKRKVA